MISALLEISCHSFQSPLKGVLNCVLAHFPVYQDLLLLEHKKCFDYLLPATNARNFKLLILHKQWS